MVRICRLLLLFAPPLLAPPHAHAAGVPDVVLSAGHQKQCLVGVGDALPELELVDPQGEPLKLATQHGKRVTVVATVGQEDWMTQQLLADLPRDVVAQYGERGVAAVVVTIGRSPKASDAPPKEHAYTLLSDPTGSAFAKLGSGRETRVYVLDAQGKIVWFDIEYSRSTRRELKQTLAALAGDE